MRDLNARLKLPTGLAALGVLVPVFGNHGLWAALMLFFAARGVTMWRVYPGIAARVGV